MQWQFPFALWTLKRIVPLIHREFGIRISRWSVARLLRQPGLSPQRPLFRAWQQDAGEVARWKAEIYPEIHPVEQVWNHARNHRIGEQVVTGPDQLKRLVLSVLRSLQRLPAVVLGCFRHPIAATSWQRGEFRLFCTS